MITKKFYFKSLKVLNRKNLTMFFQLQNIQILTKINYLVSNDKITKDKKLQDFFDAGQFYWGYSKSWKEI